MVLRTHAQFLALNHRRKLAIPDPGLRNNSIRRTSQESESLQRLPEATGPNEELKQQPQKNERNEGRRELTYSPQEVREGVGDRRLDRETN